MTRKKIEKKFTRPLQYKTDDQEYAIVTKFFGSGHVETRDIHQKTRTCRISGRMLGRKKKGGGRGNVHPSCRINVGNWVLISLREDEEEKGDVILRYTDDEVRRLKKEKKILLPEEEELEEDVGFTFGHEEEEKEEEIDIDEI